MIIQERRIQMSIYDRKILVQYQSTFNLQTKFKIYDSMDIKDFEGISYFRFLVPFLYIASWLAMTLGASFFPILYRQYTMVVFIFVASKAVYQIILNFALVLKGNAVLQRVIKDTEKQYRPMGQLHRLTYHAFAIPSYKEDVQLLAETLQVLAQHKRATHTYLIFLAMEEHEQGSDKKAEQLVARFQSRFRYIDYTRHKIRQFQQKGKASNVSWCAEHMSQKFKNIMINEQDVIVTVMDADSWAPNAYYQQLEDHLYKNYDNRHSFIYQPPQIFTRNNSEVPVLVRAYDDMYSSMHASNLVTCSGITFSFSNYSLSYSLIRRIGFWDTVEEAIAQDYHMCLKAHFKTNGQIKMIPIFAPFNQLNIQTGKGYFEDIKAKFWQIQRHARAVAEIGYIILMFFRGEFSLKSFYVVFSVMEMMLMPILIPWAVASIMFQDQVIHVEAPEGLLSPRNYAILFNVANIFVFLSCLFYQYFKRRSSKILYGIDSPHILRSLEAPLLYGVNVFGMMTSTYILGSFGNLKKNRQYIVAGKNTSNKGTSESSSKQITRAQQQKDQLLQN